MAEYGYRIPKGKVAKVYRGKEMEGLITGALKSVLSSKGKEVNSYTVKNFLGTLARTAQGGEVVVVMEQQPLNSTRAQGKWDDMVFCYNEKTGTQYARKVGRYRNPKTPAQQKQRGKYMPGVEAWRKLSEGEKDQYRKKAEKLPMTGYNLFVSKYLREK